MSNKSFNNWYSKSDKLIAEDIGKFVKHHRLQKNLTQTEVATKAKISRSTLSLLERGETVTVVTLLQVLRVLEKLNVLDAFLVSKQISPIALAKLESKERQRARNKRGLGKDNLDNDSSW